MGTITVTGLGKAFKRYPNRWARLAEWLDPRNKPQHRLHWVLQDIDFTIHAGEAVGIMGINGAGKSTLLKMITGTMQPTTGSVHITGRVAALLELGMGFHPDFTGRQNVFMASQLLGYSIEEVAHLLPGIEAFADIGDYIDRPVRTYSSGMQSRLAFAVATATRPDILIVDEALSVGDVRFQSKCYERVKKYRRQGMTLLLVSHAPMDLAKHCERAIFIKDGRVVIDGPSKDVVNLYLDTLFGRSKEDASQETTLSNVHKIQSAVMDMVFERFELRPGYRKEEHRWGKGGAKIIDYLLTADGVEYPTTVATGSHVDIYFTVRFDEDIENVTPGILIKTIEGLFIYGTNSYICSDGKENIAGRKGSLATYKFSFPMMLNEGAYLISLGVSSGSPDLQTEPVDRRYDSIILNVTNTKHMWGIVDMAANFYLEREIECE